MLGHGPNARYWKCSEDPKVGAPPEVPLATRLSASQGFLTFLQGKKRKRRCDPQGMLLLQAQLQACMLSIRRIAHLKEGAQGKGGGQPVPLVGQPLCLCAGQDGIPQPQSCHIHLCRPHHRLFRARQHTSRHLCQVIADVRIPSDIRLHELSYWAHWRLPLQVASGLPSAAGTRPTARQRQACQWSRWPMHRAVSAG